MYGKPNRVKCTAVNMDDLYYMYVDVWSTNRVKYTEVNMKHRLLIVYYMSVNVW